MEQQASAKLRALLASNITNNNEEETEMAKDLNAFRTKKEEKVTAQTEAEKSTKAPVEETKTEDKAATETVPEDQAPAKNADEKLKGLLDRAKQSQENVESKTGDTGHTNLFNDKKDVDGADDKTPEELEKEREREEKRLKREREIDAHNSLIEQACSQLESQASSKELSPKQKEFQKACSAFYVVDGLIVETSPVPEISVTRKYLKTEAGPVLQPGATKADLQKLVDHVDTTLKRANIVEYKTGFRYNYKRPGKLIGGIVSIPSNLVITSEAFNNQNFETPSVTDLKAADKITTVVNFDTLYAYGLLFCGGRIREHDSVRSGKFEGAALCGTLKADIVIVNKNENGVTATAEKRVFKAEGRQSLFVQENIIPIKTYETTSLNKLAADYDTKNAMLASIQSALNKKKEENVAAVTKLNDVAAKLVDFELDENGAISKLSVGFLNGKVALGQGEYKDLQLRHWSNSVKNTKTGKKELVEVPGLPVVKYVGHQKKDSSDIAYKKVQKVLGTDITLKDLATQFPAAGIVAELGVTELQIMKVYQSYLETQKVLREEKIRRTGGRVPTRKTSNVITNDLASRILIDQLNGKSTLDLGMNAASVSDAITSTVYHE